MVRPTASGCDRFDREIREVSQVETPNPALRVRDFGGSIRGAAPCGL